MSMSAQHKIFVRLDGKWTAEARTLLKKALEGKTMRTVGIVRGLFTN